MNYVKVGKIAHFFDKIMVAVLAVTDGEIKVDDMIRIGEEGGVEQKVDSMQVEHQQIETAKVGDDVGLKVVAAVKVGDLVYKISE